MCHFIRSLSLTVNYVHEAWHRGLQVLFFLWTHVSIKMPHRHTRTDNPHTKWWSTPTLLWEWLLKDTFVKTAERSAEVLKVREAELLVPQLWDGQTVLWLWGRRGRRRLRLLGGLLKAQGLRRRLRVATHLQDIQRGVKNTEKLWEVHRDEEGKSMKISVSAKYTKG